MFAFRLLYSLMCPMQFSPSFGLIWYLRLAQLLLVTYCESGLVPDVLADQFKTEVYGVLQAKSMTALA